MVRSSPSGPVAFSADIQDPPGHFPAQPAAGILLLATGSDLAMSGNPFQPPRVRDSGIPQPGAAEAAARSREELAALPGSLRGVQKCQKISLGAEQALHPAAWHAGYGMEPLDVTLAQGIPSLMAPLGLSTAKLTLSLPVLGHLCRAQGSYLQSKTSPCIPAPKPACRCCPEDTLAEAPQMLAPINATWRCLWHVVSVGDPTTPCRKASPEQQLSARYCPLRPEMWTPGTSQPEQELCKL